MPLNKQIHYCWFGETPLSETAEAALESWRQFAPGFEIVRWDESTFDVNACSFAHDAYAAQKWAFVSDYARFKIISEYGGIYMDVGTELIKDITPLLQYAPFSALEELSKTVNSGLILCADKADPMIEEVVHDYEATTFVDDPEWLHEHTVNEFFTQTLEKHGFERTDKWQEVGDWTILPSTYFNPVYGFGGYHIKEDTYGIHRFSGSWVEPKLTIKQQYVTKLSPVIGRRPAQIVGRTIAEFKTEGFTQGIKDLSQVARNRMKKQQ